MRSRLKKINILESTRKPPAQKTSDHSNEASNKIPRERDDVQSQENIKKPSPAAKGSSALEKPLPSSNQSKSAVPLEPIQQKPAVKDSPEILEKSTNEAPSSSTTTSEVTVAEEVEVFKSSSPEEAPNKSQESEMIGDVIPLSASQSLNLGKPIVGDPTVR